MFVSGRYKRREIILKKEFKKTELELYKRIGLWYLKGVVWESGSISRVLDRDIAFHAMLAHRHVRQGIDTDKDAQLIVESRIIITQELIQKASAYLKEKDCSKIPTSYDIDKILLVWLGPTREAFERQNQENSTGLDKMVDEGLVGLLGQPGKELYDSFFIILQSRLTRGEIAQHEFSRLNALVLARIEEASKDMLINKDMSPELRKERVDNLIASLAKECGA